MILIGVLASVGGMIFLGLLYEIFRCKHQWEFVDKTEFPPAVQEYVKAGGSRLHTWYMSTHQIEKMSKKTVVIVIRCPKCGTPKVLRETH